MSSQTLTRKEQIYFLQELLQWAISPDPTLTLTFEKYVIRDKRRKLAMIWLPPINLFNYYLLFNYTQVEDEFAYDRTSPTTHEKIL